MSSETERAEEIEAPFRQPAPPPIPVRGRYYITECEHCGWVGSSEQCGSYEDDISCPVCCASICGDEPSEADIAKHGEAVMQRILKAEQEIAALRASPPPSGWREDQGAEEIERLARLLAEVRGHHGTDALIQTMNAGKLPVWHFYADKASEFLSALRTSSPPRGWRLVPEEPTYEMISAADEKCRGLGRTAVPVLHVWGAMLAATPPPLSPTPRGKPMSEPFAGTSWSELVGPLVARCEVASKFGQQAVWEAKGAEALGQLLKTMAALLDAHSTPTLRSPLTNTGERDAP